LNGGGLLLLAARDWAPLIGYALIGGALFCAETGPPRG